MKDDQISRPRNKVGPFDYDQTLVVLEKGKVGRLFETRRVRLVVDAHGNPKTVLPEYVSPNAWDSYVGETDKVVFTRALVPILTAEAPQARETQRSAPAPRTRKEILHNVDFPAAM